MKNIFLTIFLLSICAISPAKENSFFVGTKISNGKIRFKSQFLVNDQLIKFDTKRYHLGQYVFFGGTIKNVSIYSGFGYNLYHQKINYDFNVLDPIGGQYYDRINYHMFSIPINVDYNINIYRQKLFVFIGAGLEYNLVLEYNSKGEGLKTNRTKFKDINKYFNTSSVIITSRCGLLYNINKRIDISSSFDFGYMPTKYLDYKDSNASNPTLKHVTYILSGSVGLNVKFGKNIKKEKKKTDETIKTTSYKTQQPFLLN